MTIRLVAALVMAGAVGALPPVVRIVGCQPAETEELCTELSLPVREAVPKAVEVILSFLSGPNGQQNGQREEVHDK